MSDETLLPHSMGQSVGTVLFPCDPPTFKNVFRQTLEPKVLDFQVPKFPNPNSLNDRLRRTGIAPGLHAAANTNFDQKVPDAEAICHSGALCGQLCLST